MNKWLHLTWELINSLTTTVKDQRLLVIMIPCSKLSHSALINFNTPSQAVVELRKRSVQSIHSVVSNLHQLESDMTSTDMQVNCRILCRSSAKVLVRTRAETAQQGVHTINTKRMHQ